MSRTSKIGYRILSSIWFKWSQDVPKPTPENQSWGNDVKCWKCFIGMNTSISLCYLPLVYLGKSAPGPCRSPHLSGFPSHLVPSCSLCFSWAFAHTTTSPSLKLQGLLPSHQPVSRDRWLGRLRKWVGVGLLTCVLYIIHQKFWDSPTARDCWVADYEVVWHNCVCEMWVWPCSCSIAQCHKPRLPSLWAFTSYLTLSELVNLSASLLLCKTENNSTYLIGLAV